MRCPLGGKIYSVATINYTRNFKLYQMTRNYTRITPEIPNPASGKGPGWSQGFIARATGVPPKPAICQSPIWLSALHTSNCADECGVGCATSHPYPGQIWVLFLLFTNWFRRQPGRPPDELAAGSAHAIRQVASYPGPTRLPGVNTLLFVIFIHLPCVYLCYAS